MWYKIIIKLSEMKQIFFFSTKKSKPDHFRAITFIMTKVEKPNLDPESKNIQTEGHITYI